MLAAAVAVAASADSALTASVGGLWTDNTIATSVEASVTGASAVTTTAGDITVAASASSVILADAKAGAVSASLAAAGATAIAVGLSLAHNTVDDNVYAGFGNVARVSTGGGALSVTASDTMRIDVSSLAVAVSVALAGGGSGVAIAGGGSESTNVILGSAIADISGGALGTAASPVGAVTVSATSTAAITATVIGVAGSVAFGTSNGVAVALGVAVARNFVGWGSSAAAFDTTSDKTLSGGLATGTRVKLAGERSSSRVSGARAGEIYQYVGAPVSGSVDLTKQDFSDGTLWKQLGLDRDADQVRASLTASSVNSTGALTVTALGAQSILATVLAGAVAIGGGGSTGVAVSGAGVYAENKIAADTRALITGDGATGISAASVALRATDASGIQALAGAASIAVSLAGSNAISVALALSIAFNEVSNQVEAAVTGADQGLTTTSGGVSALAEAVGRPLFTFTPSGLVTAAGLDDAAVADLDDTTHQPDQRGHGRRGRRRPDPQPARGPVHGPVRAARRPGWKLDVVRPGLVWKVSDTIPPAQWATTPVCERSYLITWDAANNRFQVSAPTIEVASLGAAFAAGFSGSLGLAISGAGAVAMNSVLSTANAHIDDSTVTSAAGVALTATNDAGITATVVSLAAAIGASGSTGIGVAIGVSVARNLIGSTPDGGGTPSETQAYVLRSSLAAQGDLTATATSRETISAIVLAGTAAVGAAGSVGIAAAGSGTWTENRIATKIGAFIDGDGATGISAAAVRLSATDDASIGAITAAVALSFAFGGDVGVSLAIGVALAHNEIANQIQAAVRNVAHQLTTTVGGVSLDARETAGIRVISAAAAIAVGAGFYAGIAIAGAGAEASNAIYTKVNAYLDAAKVNAKTTVALSAADTSTIRAIVAAVSVSIGIGAAGVGVGIGAALATNTIGTALAADYSSAQSLSGGLANGKTVSLASGPDQGDVYRYIGTGLSGTVALSTQNYADATQWTLVGRASGAQAFSRGSTVVAAGAMTATATAGQTIEALTLAGTAVVSAGAVGIGLGGAGASTINEVAALVAAYVDGGSVTAASLALSASDVSTITTLTAAVGVAFSFAAAAAVSIAVAVGLARNRIANDVGAYVAGATVSLGTGALQRERHGVRDDQRHGGRRRAGRRRLGAGSRPRSAAPARTPRTSSSRGPAPTWTPARSPRVPSASAPPTRPRSTR